MPYNNIIRYLNTRGLPLLLKCSWTKAVTIEEIKFNTLPVLAAAICNMVKVLKKLTSKPK